MTDLHSRADALRGAVNQASGLIRNLYFTFLLLGTYVAIIIGSTTDRQLIEIAPVTLPILNTQLPIVGFYILIPWFVLLFHFNVLLQLSLLAEKLHSFNAVIDSIDDPVAREEQKAGIYQFPFNIMLIDAGRTRERRIVFAAMVWLTVILLPLMLLVGAQIAFLPYHSIGATWSQRVAIMLDLAMLWFFWPAIISPGLRVRSWLVQSARRLAGRIMKPAKSKVAHDDSSALATAASVEEPGPGVRSLLMTTVVLLTFSQCVAVIPGEFVETASVTLFPTVFQTEPERPEESPRVLLTDWLFDRNGALFHRNLRLPDTILVGAEVSISLATSLRTEGTNISNAQLDQVPGINLAGRDLRFADLRNTVLVKANLRGANLEGADLRDSNLLSADMRPLEVSTSGECADKSQQLTLDDDEIKEASLLTLRQGTGSTIVCRTSIKQARVSTANLVDVMMPIGIASGVDLQRALVTDLRAAYTDFSGASLAESDVRTADFHAANLQDVSFVSANLSGANLTDSNLAGANLTGAQLADANMRNASVEGWIIELTNLTHAILPVNAPMAGARLEKIEGAEMLGADLRGADLSRADARGVILENADLREANLSGANLRGSRLSNSDLSNATLSGAMLDLIYAPEGTISFRGATMNGVSMIGAHLSGAEFNSANLHQARFSASILEGAQFTGADLTSANFDRARTSGANFDLSDVRNIDRNQLSEREYNSLRNDIGSLAEGGATLFQMVGSALDDPISMLREVPSETTRGIFVSCDPKDFSGDNHICVTRDQLTRYAQALIVNACDSEAEMRGLMRRAFLWDQTNQLNRRHHTVAERGTLVEGGPGPALASQLLVSDCQGVTIITAEQRQTLTEIAKHRALP